MYVFMCLQVRIQSHWMLHSKFSKSLKFVYRTTLVEVLEQCLQMKHSAFVASNSSLKSIFVLCAREIYNADANFTFSLCIFSKFNTENSIFHSKIDFELHKRPFSFSSFLAFFQSLVLCDLQSSQAHNHFSLFNYRFEFLGFWFESIFRF